MKQKFLVIAMLICSCTNTTWSQTEIGSSRIISSQRKIIIQSQDKIIVHDKKRIAISDEDKKRFAGDRFTESKFAQLKKFEARLLSASGSKIKVLDKKDIEESTLSFYSIYNEHKTKYYSLLHPTLPYICEKYKKYELKSSFFLPNWDPQWGSIDVEYASLEIVLESPVKFKYVNIGAIDEPQIFQDKKGHTHYKWEVRDVLAYESEYHRTPEATFQIGVKLFAEEFTLEGYQGSSQSWQSFGDWYIDLVGTRSNFKVPPVEFAAFKKLPVEERVQNIYQLLQEKTRYVQIYLGIDGWQPHPVDEIHKNQYGDCKDLSMYMIAMLEQAGVQAYPGLAFPRNYGWVDEDYPGNQFNHCISVVPLPSDTLWLECTADVTAFNNPPAGLEGVNILLVKPGSSRLVRTPVSPAKDNKSVFTAHVSLTTARKAKMQGKVVFTGNRAVGARQGLWELDYTKQKKWFANRLAEKAGDVRIDDLAIKNLKTTNRPLEIEFTATLNYFAKKAGSRMIFKPRFFHNIYYDGEAPEKRKMALYNMTRFWDQDSVTFSLPFGYTNQRDIKSDSISSQFGKYFSRMKPEGNNLLWTSTFVSRAREIPLNEYADYHDFMTVVKKQAGTKFVIRKLKK
ncbi:MAG: DUF3857 domain-containing protein [Calditrichaeota bacterium]|nr:MAG: DUF3857 domain-containing protein [Calditrichota bacterium]